MIRAVFRGDNGPVLPIAVIFRKGGNFLGGGITQNVDIFFFAHRLPHIPTEQIGWRKKIGQERQKAKYGPAYDTKILKNILSYRILVY